MFVSKFIFLSFIFNYFVIGKIEKFATDTLEKKYGKIIRASILFRHGNRTPIQTYPTDPYQNYSWPNGLGQLTKTGEQAEYELGKWFNKRYEFFIRSNLTYRHLKMDSSDIDRTIMSAQLFLAGFFPPRKLEKINIKLLWRPIPVHTIASEIDNLISFRRNCSSYEYYHENYLNTSVKMKKTYKNYEKEIQYVEKYSGLKFSTKQAGVIINELNLYVTDTLIVQNENKLILPSWTKKVFPVPLIKIKDQTFQIAVNEFKIKRLQAGPLLKSIAADMNMKTKTSFPQVFHFYSGHDITIITIMITLGIYNYITPPYAASLIFELRKKENENIVTVLYKNSTTTKPYLMEIPKCGSICKLQTFLTILKSYIPTNWDAECRSK